MTLLAVIPVAVCYDSANFAVLFLVPTDVNVINYNKGYYALIND